jgi:transposase-like protein
MPRHVLEEYKEKRARQEFMEYSSGLMEIQCPHCRHYSKVKVGPVMHCPKCARQW